MDELIKYNIFTGILYKDCFQNVAPFLIFAIIFSKANPGMQVLHQTQRNSNN